VDTRLSKGLVAVALLAVFLIAVGPASAADPTQIRADINTDMIGLGQWPADASVTVTVWDSPAKGTLLFSEVVLVDSTGSGGPTYPGLAPGQHVVATDGITTKELTLVAIQGVVDPVADTVTGTAPANVGIDVDTGFGCRVTMSDGDGNWSVDFSVDPGNGPDCNQILDLGMGPGRVSGVTPVTSAADPDGDQTTAHIEVPDFPDSYGSIFVEQIAWMATQGITLGCNPPTNDQYCPADNVTRGQMAAFLVRALGLTDSGAGDLFTDDDGSIFESNIDKLATAGITLGCNPPTNDQFCPDDNVTRGQMAAFLVRALGLTDSGAGDLFTDDDGSVFESNIDKLATAGITLGCNPPTNDQFCPDDNVTRGQMAAFLQRALG
jgi:S-layer homology domain